jgi:alpha-1,2-mannosyltransferase
LPSPADFDGRPKLVLIGGCRDASDEARVAKLREFAASLSVEHDVEFQINVDSRTLASYLGSALICVHTMWNEHFGISCVEAQASGCVLLAHNSGGPRQDIAVVQDGTPRSHVCSLRMLSLIVFHCYR